MSPINTYSGILFDPLECKDEDIQLIDIAHALSLLCRGNGHVCFFYSVGQHCIYCYHEAKKRNYSNAVQLACLLHDANEAYICDLPRPIKKIIPEHKQLEDKLQNQIFNKFLTRSLTLEESTQVFDIDDTVLSYEFVHLMPQIKNNEYPSLLHREVLSFQHPLDVENDFLSIASELLKNTLD